MLILVEILLIIAASVLLWYGGVTIEGIASFVTASALGIYLWNKGVSRVVRKLREIGATSPETAIKPEQAGITWESIYLELVAEKTKDGRYYLKKK